MPDDSPATKADLNALEQRINSTMKELRDYIDERTRDMQTELLRGFRIYPKMGWLFEWRRLPPM